MRGALGTASGAACAHTLMPSHGCFVSSRSSLASRLMTAVPTADMLWVLHTSTGWSARAARRAWRWHNLPHPSAHGCMWLCRIECCELRYWLTSQLRAAVPQSQGQEEQLVPRQHS